MVETFLRHSVHYIAVSRVVVVVV